MQSPWGIVLGEWVAGRCGVAERAADALADGAIGWAAEAGGEWDGRQSMAYCRAAITTHAMAAAAFGDRLEAGLAHGVLRLGIQPGKARRAVQLNLLRQALGIHPHPQQHRAGFAQPARRHRHGHGGRHPVADGAGRQHRWRRHGHGPGGQPQRGSVCRDCGQGWRRHAGRGRRRVGGCWHRQVCRCRHRQVCRSRHWHGLRWGGRGVGHPQVGHGQCRHGRQRHGLARQRCRRWQAGARRGRRGQQRHDQRRPQRRHPLHRLLQQVGLQQPPHQRCVDGGHRDQPERLAPWRQEGGADAVGCGRHKRLRIKLGCCSVRQGGGPPQAQARRRMEQGSGHGWQQVLNSDAPMLTQMRKIRI